MSTSAKIDKHSGRSKRGRPLDVEHLERRTLLDGHGLNPTNAFVSAAFQEVLVREVDQTSLTFFSSALQNGGMTPLVFAGTLTHSVEYFSRIVTTDYVQFLGRAPDADGLAFWNGLMQQGMTDEQMAAQFIATPEFFNHCGGTNQGWVDGMYFDLLGRSPDAQGEANWVAALNAGMPRWLAAFGFASSAEREAIVVQNDYQSFLGREASAGEVDGWVNRFSSGMTNENIIAGFVASQEFMNEAQSGLIGSQGLGNSGPVTVNINIGTININSGNTTNINSGNVNSNIVNSGNVNPAPPAPHGPPAAPPDHHGPHGDN